MSPRFDLDLDELREYRPPVREPADFDEFWDRTLEETRAASSPAVLDRVDGPISRVEVFDVAFAGFAGDPVHGWLLLPPRAADERLPAVVTYRGYGGGRGDPVEHLAWPAAGYAHLVMDTRGQGSGWGRGRTADPHGSGPAYPGVMTRGIEDPAAYYYRRVFADAVMAVDLARSLPQIDDRRIAVTGESQGGGIALAAAALAGGLLAALIDVPFLCHFERAVGMTGEMPYQELVQYLAVHRDREREVFTTLSYFDGVNMARRITAPALFSTALMDQVCPPSTVFAAYNACPADPKAIEVYPFNGHEGGRPDQWTRQVGFLSGLAG